MHSANAGGGRADHRYHRRGDQRDQGAGARHGGERRHRDRTKAEGGQEPCALRRVGGVAEKKRGLFRAHRAEHDAHCRRVRKNRSAGACGFERNAGGAAAGRAGGGARGLPGRKRRTFHEHAGAASADRSAAGGKEKDAADHRRADAGHAGRRTDGRACGLAGRCRHDDGPRRAGRTGAGALPAGERIACGQGGGGAGQSPERAARGRETASGRDGSRGWKGKGRA